MILNMLITVLIAFGVPCLAVVSLVAFGELREWWWDRRRRRWLWEQINDTLLG